MSFNSVTSSNNFVSQGSLISRSVIFSGNNDDSKSPLLQKSNFGVGSAYTQGNTVRSFYDMNSGPPLIYTPTSSDIILTQNRYPSIFNNYPILKEYPWLYPYEETYPDVIDNSSSRPVYNIMGKGLGVVEIYNAGSPKEGNYIWSKPSWMEYYYNFLIEGDIPLQPKLKNINGVIYPYSGKLYSGQIVQYDFQNGKELSVIPYQAGRGIPQWDVASDYYSGAPFGIPKLGNGLTLKPFLSPGAAPGNNDFCLGIALESGGRNKLFKYREPSGMNKTNLKNEPWENHPAPFSVGPQNISDNRIHQLASPGPNLSGSYWAPWPWYYAYNEGDKVPVLTKGKTTGRVGAAFNIGMQCYYEPDVEAGDDPRNNDKYIPVQCIPLFQGEKVKVGSEIYSTAMGHVITWNRRGVSPYPVASVISCNGLQLAGYIGQINNSVSTKNTVGNSRDARGENPWWDWWDPTFGSIGWTSTPGFSLAGIPDEGVSIAQSKIVDLPYMCMSLQGTVIVRASTTKNPIDEGGSGRGELIGSGDYTTVDNKKFKRISKMSGDSERSQIIGNSLQEIEGTGRWNYDGAYDFGGSFSIQNGLYYENNQIYELVPANKLSNGKGSAIEVTSVDADGSILTFNFQNSGSGYQDGELVRVINSNDKYVSGTPYFIGNCSVMKYNTTSPTFSPGGSNYISQHGCMGFNISKNSGVIQIEVLFTNKDNATIPGQDKIIGSYGVPYSYIMKNVKDYSMFTPGRTFWALNLNTSQKLTKTSSLILFYVRSNNGTDIELGIYGNFCGDNFSYEQGTFDYAIQFAGNYYPMELTIKANSDGQVEDIKVTDIGNGNVFGDKFIIYQPGSDNNCIFEFDGTVTDIILPFREGGTGYNFTQTNSAIWDEIRNIGNIGTSNKTIRMKYASRNGNVYGLSWNHILEDSGSAEDIYYDYNSIDVPLGSKQKFIQKVTINQGNQPINRSGNRDWDSFAFRDSATFTIQGYPRILVNGEGYQLGQTTVTGGSGSGMVIQITKVGDKGEVEDVEILDYGTGILSRDIIFLDGGNNNCKIILYTQPTDDVVYYLEIQGFLTTGVPFTVMQFDYELLNKGSSYQKDFLYGVTCPNRPGINMQIRVDSTDSNGGIEAFTFMKAGNGLYEIGNVCTVDGGDCYFKLKKPLKPIKTVWHSRGSGYTTATNVPTINMQMNNLITLCDLNNGTCVPFDYNDSSYFRPTLWDLSRYDIGDQLEFIQGVNNSAVYNINNLNLITGDIEFTQVNPGSGYIEDNTQYAWIQTRNLTPSPTTVDITADSNGEIVSITLNTIGDRYRIGDQLIISQPGSDNNAVVEISVPKNVTPWWEEKINGRTPTAQQWNDYKESLKSGVNLFDNQVVMDMKMNYPNYMNNSYYNNGDGGRDYINNVSAALNCTIS